MKSDLIPPAQLWLGTANTLLKAIIPYLQAHFCTHKGCGSCISCKQIHEQQHYAVIWICPEKGYTIDLLDIIHERIAFTLAEDQHTFFVLQKADLLTTQCANSLLKSIEEPPTGYHFILCAEREEYILPTIISRCIIRSFAKESTSVTYQTLYTYFTAYQPQDPLPFLKEIQNSAISEHESLDLADQLLAYWMEQYKQTADHGKQRFIMKRIEILKEALLKSPMPGSSKLFWKNLFLHYNAS